MNIDTPPATGSALMAPERAFRSSVATIGNAHHRPSVNGTLYIRDLTIPPSDLWSREFQQFHAATLNADPDAEFAWPIPERTAPKRAWDEFDAWVDERCNAPVLAAARRNYRVEIEDTRIAGVRVAIVTPADGIKPVNDRRVLLSLHGGSFVINRGIMGGLIESIPVAAIGRIKVITLDYRQAPFHQYPAASEDVQTVYTELLRSYEPGSIGIYGFSAGGVLCAQALARFQFTGVPRPGAAGILGIAPPPPFGRTPPWGEGWGDSSVWFSGRPRNQPTPTERSMGEVGKWYMESASPDDPQAYPGISDAVLEGFPSTLFLSGTRDFAFSSVVAAHARFVKLGVDASLYAMEGAPHGAHVMAIGTPEAHDAQSYIARWFEKHLGR